MKKQRLRATSLVAAGVVVGGILAGTLGAQAADESAGQSDPQPGMVMRAHHRGPGGPDRGEDLAKALGVSEEKLKAAFEAVRDEVDPPKPGDDGPPTAADRDKMTAALAKELGLSEAKVEAAFDKVHKAHRAEHRDALNDRLNAAIKDGKLTKDDKKSVLKAFDAGVLGGPGGRGLR